MKLNKKKGNSTAEQKRRLILNAAVRVFSEKGYHRCRISDIASEANVAYGLVYHYFENKEEILNSIFDENWGLLIRVIETVDEQSDKGLEDKLQAIVDFILDAYRLVPDVIQVIVMEIARSSKFLNKPKVDAFERAFERLAEIFAKHQQSGQLRSDLDPKLMAYMFFGSIELILTAYLLGTLSPSDDERYEFNKRMITNACLRGIQAQPAPDKR